MKISLLTSYSADRIACWHERAVNDPTVHRWYAYAGFTSMPLPPTNDDWQGAIFMDEQGRGMMSLSFDRLRKACGISLFVLNKDAKTAAAFMRYFINVLVCRYEIRTIDFAVAETNVQWLEHLERLVPDAKWGIEPESLHDPLLGRWVAGHKFKVRIESGTTLKDYIIQRSKQHKTRNIHNDHLA